MGGALTVTALLSTTENVKLEMAVPLNVSHHVPE
jgi:hypothetical protein